MSLDPLREAWAARSGGGHDCPADDLLWAAARGEAGAEAARRVALHLAGCAVCTGGWRLARDLGGMALGGTERTAGAASRRWWALSAAAAALMVALVSIEIVDRIPPRSTSVRRGGGDGVIRSLLPPERPLSRGECVLRWSGPAGARYDVRVAREDLTPVAEARSLQAPEYRVPPDPLAALPPGTRLIWQVKGTSGDGAPLPVATFVVTLE